jgi:Cu2+-containing amine oxidase
MDRPARVSHCLASHQCDPCRGRGEWGLGFMTTSLGLGCDCLGEISYLATLHDAAGQPYDIPRAICVHEEDNGARRWRLSGPGA